MYSYEASDVQSGELMKAFLFWLVKTIIFFQATAKGAVIVKIEKIIVTTPGADNKKEL
jgi:hypothetical protein